MPPPQLLQQASFSAVTILRAVAIPHSRCVCCGWCCCCSGVATGFCVPPRSLLADALGALEVAFADAAASDMAGSGSGAWGLDGTEMGDFDMDLDVRGAADAADRCLGIRSLVLLTRVATLRRKSGCCSSRSSDSLELWLTSGLSQAMHPVAVCLVSKTTGWCCAGRQRTPGRAPGWKSPSCLTPLHWRRPSALLRRSSPASTPVARCSDAEHALAETTFMLVRGCLTPKPFLMAANFGISPEA